MSILYIEAGIFDENGRKIGTKRIRVTDGSGVLPKVLGQVGNGVQVAVYDGQVTVRVENRDNEDGNPRTVSVRSSRGGKGIDVSGSASGVNASWPRGGDPNLRLRVENDSSYVEFTCEDRSFRRQIRG